MCSPFLVFWVFHLVDAAPVLEIDHGPEPGGTSILVLMRPRSDWPISEVIAARPLPRGADNNDQHEAGFFQLTYARDYGDKLQELEAPASAGLAGASNRPTSQATSLAGARIE